MTTNYPHPYSDNYFIEVRVLESVKNSKPHVKYSFISNEDNLGFIKGKYEEIVEKLENEIH